MLDEGPSKLYDAVARVLGLDDLVEADAALSTPRKDRQRATKQVNTGYVRRLRGFQLVRDAMHFQVQVAQVEPAVFG